MSQSEYERIGDYEVLDHLGAGGMGDVYKVRHVISGRVEAMKVIRPQLLGNKLAEDRFSREIRVLAELDHPNIARLFTAIQVEGSVAMIMEYIEGATIERFLQDGPLTIEETNYYTSQVLAALAYAHKRGVVHRDMKPANCMVTRDGVVKLMDFGLARSSSQRGVSSGGTAGTFDYMPPEQIQAKTIDERTDLYALGVSMFEMVTGKLPFPHDTEYSILTAHLTEQPRRPVDLTPAVPLPLNDIILKLLEKEPKDRYQSAAEVQDALQGVGGRTTSSNAANAVRRVTEVDYKVPPVNRPSGPGSVRRTPTRDMRDTPPPTPMPPPLPPVRPKPWAAIVLGGVVAVSAAGGGVYAAMHHPKAADGQQGDQRDQQQGQGDQRSQQGGSGGQSSSVQQSGKSQKPTPPADPRVLAGKQAEAAEKLRREEMAKQQRAVLLAKNTPPPIVITPPAGGKSTPPPSGSSNFTPSPNIPMRTVLTPEQSAKLSQVQEQITSIESGSSGVTPVIENMRRLQAQQGVVMRGDVTSHQSDMTANLRQARQALKAEDPDGAAVCANKAQADLDFLKHWAGQQ